MSVSNKRIPSRLNVAMKQAGLAIQKFAPEKLGISYQMFYYRMRNGCLRLSDYHTLMLYTGKSFDELWPNPLKPNHQPITLNLSPHNNVPVSRLTTPPVKESVKPVIPSVSPSSLVEEPKKRRIVDVYEDLGGLPPSDETQAY